jgi:methylmalonyl-CoA/ethylmalonyl-CoA epimerase
MEGSIMITGIGHLGVFVKNIEATVAALSKFVPLPVPAVREVPERGIRVAVVHIGQVGLELIQDLTPKGPLARTLAEKGNFIHHFCLLSDAIEEDAGRLAAQGVEMADPLPKVGLRGKKIVMTTPAVLDGIAVELSEP